MKAFIQKLRQSNALILDTETTGVDGRAEILQIAIVSLDGEELFNSLVQPAKARRWPDAQSIHGLSWDHVKAAPLITDLAAELQRIMDGKIVAVYNAEFDTRMLQQSIKAAGAQDAYRWLQTRGWPCVMKAYAEYYGQRNTHYGGFRWQSLSDACRQQRIPVAGAHDALTDAKLTAALLRQIEQNL